MTAVGPGAAGAAPTVARSRPALGVLLADANDIPADRAAGISEAMIGLYWDAWEPSAGAVDRQYVAAVEAEVHRYRRAGFRVAVDLGLQYAPSWALALPGGRLVDEHGATSGVADFWFSRAVRSAAAAYIRGVVGALGRSVQEYRVGLSEAGEALYPDVDGDDWWAYNAQAQGTAPGLPAGVGVSPLRGWVPADATWRGSPVTGAQVVTWYQWYFHANVNALAWEVHTYRSAGFKGQLDLVIPGTGSLPAFYEERLAAHLAPGGEDAYNTLNTGAVWWKLLDGLGAPTLRGVALDVSSVDDYSGSPRGNHCQAGDAAVPATSPYIWSWSDARYLTYLARAHRMPVLGETTGWATPADLPTVMGLASSCALRSINFAWESELDNGTVTRSQLTSAYQSPR